ncbi:MAG: alpha/beta hydrolase fold domain-containing protein, partial [Clostridia bacterium]
MSIIGKFFTFNDLVRDKLCNNLNYPNVTVIKDICYDKSNEKVCTADLFFDKSKLPKSGKYPVMLKIHGGGWIVGDKKFRRGYALQLADEGVFVVNINYALAPEYTFPYPIQNCFAALAWIKNNANKYHLDLDSLFVAGDSAGAHMTAVVCAALTNPDYRKKLGCPDVDIKPVGALHYCGIYDFNTYKLRLPITRAMLRDYTGCKVKNASSWEYYGLLNPINYINSEYPPSLVVSAKK